MPIKTNWIAACMIFAAVVASGTASARGSIQPARGGASSPDGVLPGLRQADGDACVQQCPDDRNPCDPPAFKQADGRCAQER